jgi:PAS domain S-box-containing protein
VSGDSELGLIVLSLSEVNLGQIKMCNTQAGYIFDYPKKDLLKKRINEIMPKLYAVNHDYFLQIFLKNKNKKVNTDERLVLGKNKNGYIFPIFLQLRKAMISMNDELVFIANIRTVKQTESATFCICSDQG